MKIARAFDYLTFTSDEPPRGWGHPEQINSPVRFYKTGLRYACGTLASFGNPNSDKWLVSMSAKAIASRGLQDDTTARRFMKQRIGEGCKFSRVDMAVTVEHDGNVSIDDVRDWIQSGDLVGPKHRIEHVKTIHNEREQRGETIYIGDMGKRAKRGIIRIYDKGLEMGKVANKITRFEVEEKRDTAHHIARSFNDGQSIAQLIASRLQFNNDMWRQLTVDELPERMWYKSDEIEHEGDKTWVWLIEQIAPVLGRKSAMSEHENEMKYLRAFMSRWTNEHHDHLLTLVNKE